MLATLASPSASAAVRDDRKFLLSSDHAASTTMAPRKVPDRLYKPIDSFGSKVELHAEDDESKDDGKATAKGQADAEEGEKAKESEKIQEAETGKESEKAQEEAEKAKESEKAQEAETAKESKKAQEAEKVEKDNGAEKAEEDKKTEAEGAEPTTTPSPADTVPPAPAPKYPVGQGIQYDHAEYEDDWHTEWSHGDYPNYKEVHSEGEKLEQYEDRQSDGKASSPGGMYAAEDKKKKD